MTQKEHFLLYYGSKEDKKATYQYLRCPQLLLFIAEFVGVSGNRLNSAFQILKEYEEQNKIKSIMKNGNYIYGKKVLRDIKIELQISMIVRIINESVTWKQVKEKVEELQ